MEKKSKKHNPGTTHEGQNSPSTSLVLANTSSPSSREVHIVSFESSFPTPEDSLPWTANTVELPPQRNLTAFHPKALISSTIPTVEPTTGTATASVLYARTKLRLASITPGFFSLPRDDYNRSNPPYGIRPAGSKGLGMFATRQIEIGDLIFVEMPLIVLPLPLDLSGVTYPDIDDDFAESACHEEGLLAMLKVAFGRMRKEDQDAYLGLYKGHWQHQKEMCELLYIWRANVFEISGLDMGCYEDRYGAVGNLLSKVNHSCRPNCAHTFSPDSFTLELRATRNIAPGEEILYSYCDPCTPTATRQAFLNRNHGISCSCLSCSPNSDSEANDTTRCSIPSRIHALARLTIFLDFTPGRSDPQRAYTDALRVYETSTSIMRDMEAEGLDGYGWYADTIGACFVTCVMLGRISESRGDMGGLLRWKEVGRGYLEKSVRCNIAADGSYVMKKKNEERQRGDLDGVYDQHLFLVAL